MMNGLDDLLNAVETVVTDSCPISCPKISVTRPEVEEEEEEDDEEVEDVPSDNEDDSCKTWDQTGLQAGSINIADSSRVHVGNQLHDHRQFHVGKTNTVTHHVIDMRRINVQYHRSELDHPQPNAVKLKQEEDVEHVRKVEQFLRNLYKSCLSLTTPLPWCKDFTLHLEEFYVSLQIIRTTRRGHYSTSLEKLFSPEEWSGPIRLLVEGNPGYGKTTLAIRLCTDWARGAPYLQSFVLVFLVQLRDFRGDLQGYIFKERYPQEDEAPMREALWSYVVNNQDRVLFLLDGLDELAEEHAGPINSLVRGQLLQRVGVVVTSRPLHSGHDLLRAFPTRVVLQGFSDEQVRNFVSKYFAGAHNPLSGQELTRIIFDSQYSVYRSLSTCPLMCQLICVFFEDEGQRLPQRMTDVYLSLIRCLLSRNLIRNGRGVSSPGGNTISADHEQMLCQFGRLCLEALLINRTHFTREEVSAVTDLDFLVKRYELCAKSKAASGGQGECYQPLHSMFIEFLAAYYLRSLVKNDEDSSTLRQELKRLEPTSRHVPSRFLVLKFLMGLLGEDAHRYLPLVSDFNLPPVFMFDLLKESGTLPQSASSVASSMDQEVITVYSGDVELEGWGHVIADPSCIVKTLEFRRTQPCSEENLENFFTALAVNLSVDSLTLEFPYHAEMTSAELQRWSHYVGLALRKKNLRNFVLKGPIRTGAAEDDSLEESVSQPIVDTIAASVRVNRPESLQSLTLEVDLDSGQLRQLKQAVLLGMPNLRHLVLSKIWCGVRGFQSIAALLAHHPALSELTVSLNRSNVWNLLPSAGGEHQPGSPTDLKDLNALLPKEARRRSRVVDDEEIKEEGEVGCPCGCRNEASPRASSPNPGRVVLSSDRLEFTSFNHLFGDGNAAKLHFLKGTGYLDLKIPMPPGMTKSCRIPLPVCVSHDSGFHHLFATLKHSSCRLTRLDLKECYLDKTDFACLGEALRKTKTLESFELVDQNLESLLPLIVAISQNRTIKSLVLRSRNILLDDTTFQLFCRSLCGNEVLHHLDISGWTIELKESRSVDVFSRLLTSSRLEELEIAETRVHIEIPTSGMTREQLQSLCRSLPSATCIRQLNLDQAELTLGENRVMLNGGLLLPALTWCPALKELNLSVSPPVLNHGHLFLDDEMCRGFFGALAKSYGRTLERLHLQHWQFLLQEPKKTAKEVEKSLRQCERITHLHVNNMQNPNMSQNRAWLLESMILALPKLKLLSLVRIKLSPKQGQHLGQLIRDKWMGSFLVLHIRMVPEEAVQELMSMVMSAQRLQVDYVGGFKDYLIIKAKTKPRRLMHLVNPKARN